MDASSVPSKLGTDGAFIPSPSPSSKPTKLTFPPRSCKPEASSPPGFSTDSNPRTRDIDVIVTYSEHDDQTKIHENNKQKCEINRKTSFDANMVNTNSKFIAPRDFGNDNQQTRDRDKSRQNSVDSNRNNADCALAHNNNYSLRSVSSPQLSTKPLTRSKVYRKTSLKYFTKPNCPSETSTIENTGSYRRGPLTRIVNMSSKSTLSSGDSKKPPSPLKNESDLGVPKGKWNNEDVHIICNPLSTPYPYSTPCQKVENNNTVTTEQSQSEDEPKSRSCGSFLPILALIPQTVISFQYLSPKMKFSWWRNKIS